MDDIYPFEIQLKTEEIIKALLWLKENDPNHWLYRTHMAIKMVQLGEVDYRRVS